MEHQMSVTKTCATLGCVVMLLSLQTASHAQQGRGQKVAEAKPGDLRVMVTAAIRTPLEAVRAEAQKAVGKPLVIEYGSARGNLKNQILAGQPFEVAMLLPDVDEELGQHGKIRPGSVVIARVPVAIGQRGDAPKIDMSTPAALKAAMLKAKSLRWSPTGAALLTVNKILDTLDIQDAVKSRHNLPGTVPLGPGEYELNIYPLSEILENKELTNLGPVIPELQAPAVITAVVSSTTPGADAARAFIKFLQGPALDPALKASGMTR
jgi:molybdate transport system substrate-binding protein